MSSDTAIYDCTLTVINKQTGESSGASFLAILDDQQFIAYVRPYADPGAIVIVTSQHAGQVDVPRDMLKALQARSVDRSPGAGDP